jgi:hypothetical protein
MWTGYLDCRDDNDKQKNQQNKKRCLFRICEFIENHGSSKHMKQWIQNYVFRIWIRFRFRIQIWIQLRPTIKVKFNTHTINKSTNFIVYFFGGLDFVGHSFAYVVHFVFLGDVWSRAAVASRCATNLATHLPLFRIKCEFIISFHLL